MAPDSGPEERKPPRGLASSGAQSAARRYSLYVGIVFIAFAIFAFISTRLSDSTDEGGPVGLEAGNPLPPFAAPDALGSLEGDANIFQDDCESSRIPCPAGERRTPACEIEKVRSIRVCDLFDKPLAISFWFTRGGDCLPSQDTFETLSRRYGEQVNFLSVNVRDERAEVRQIVEERDWELPVAYDADGAVSNLYRVGVCPFATLAYPGGIVSGTVVGEGEFARDALAEQIDQLIADSRERAEADR
jgi:hypothetical protein